MPPFDLRAIFISAIEKTAADRGGSLQSGSILSDVAKELREKKINIDAQAILTEFSELFRTGYLAWGYDLSNANPPFFHVTERGRKLLERASSDPGNPAGYLRRLTDMTHLHPIAESYLREGLDCYVAGQFKAAAVMVGAAAEDTIIQLRHAVEYHLKKLARKPLSKDLSDWRVSRILGALDQEFASRKMAHPLSEAYEAHWSSFTYQIRRARNDAGHPTSIEPVTFDTVQASLLIFPEMAKVANDLELWVDTWTS